MSVNAPPPPPPPGVSEEAWCKNRLQEYTQKASIPLPVYVTDNEGSAHAPQFRTRVWVDGTCFISPNTFPDKKTSEQDAAKLALAGLRIKVNNEGRLRILEDTTFCKSIISEYASKMNLERPTYETNQSKAVFPIFVSSFSLNGVTYTGEAAKNKKEAEQFAARSAVLSILEKESGTTMSEIVKSKFKLFDELKKLKKLSSIKDGMVTAALNQSEERIDASERAITAPLATIPLSSISLTPAVQVSLSDTALEQPSNTLATYQPSHEYRKPGAQNSPAPTALPIVFVPPASVQPPESSTSGKKRKRKKKNAKEQVQHQPPLTAAMTPPQTLLPACSVAQ